MFIEKHVRDVMNSSIVPLNKDMYLAEAVDHILSSHYIGLPVVDTDNKLVGFLSEHDCLRLLITSSYYLEGRTCVSDIMHTEVLAVSANESVLKLAERMDTGKPKIYPVCEEGLLVGIITRSDVMRVLNETLKNTKVAI